MRKELVGCDVTLVSKGIRHTDYSDQTWIDTTQVGRTSFFKVSSIGRKYLHGTYIYWDEEGRHNRDWPSKVIIEDYLIYNGIHHDFEERYDKYYAAVNAWKEAEEKTRRKTEWETRDYVAKQMDKWRAKNPIPEPPKFDTIETLI